MPGATRTFRVPCHCSATVLVGLGQAGTEAVCPSCGATITVPRLRELATFEVAEAARTETAWSAGHAWLLVGLVIAAVASLAAGILSQFDGGASQRLPDERLIRAAVESADAATVHKAWIAVKRSGVDRGAIAEESLVQRAANTASRVALLMWTVAAGGALAAIGGAIASVRSRAQPGEAER